MSVPSSHYLLCPPLVMSNFLSLDNVLVIRVQVYLNLCMNFGQFQPSTWCTLDNKTTQIWSLANLEYKHLKLWLLFLL